MRLVYHGAQKYAVIQAYFTQVAALARRRLKPRLPRHEAGLRRLFAVRAGGLRDVVSREFIRRAQGSNLGYFWFCDRKMYFS